MLSLPVNGAAPAARVNRAKQVPTVTDQRYQQLLGPAAWAQLPPAVQRRFSRPLAPDRQRIYRGQVLHTELSLAGWMLAQLARLVGGPLPFTHGATGPSVVIVSEASARAGQIWTRSYARSGAFPQIVQSAKRFRGPTGLEEDLGHGLSMRLTTRVDDGDLVFTSAGYDLRFFGRQVQLPRWLSPGRCEVRHRAEDDSHFTFTLKLVHPILGQLLEQTALYCDEIP